MDDAVFMFATSRYFSWDGDVTNAMLDREVIMYEVTVGPELEHSH